MPAPFPQKPVQGSGEGGEDGGMNGQTDAHPECECALNEGSYTPAAFKEAWHTPATQGRGQNADKRMKSHPALLYSSRSQQLSRVSGRQPSTAVWALLYTCPARLATTQEASLRPVCAEITPHHQPRARDALCIAHPANAPQACLLPRAMKERTVRGCCKKRKEKKA